MIMIALNRQSTRFNETHGGINTPFRVRSISHIIPEKHDLVDPTVADIVEGCRKAFAVAVDIGHDRHTHDVPPSPAYSPGLHQQALAVPFNAIH